MWEFVERRLAQEATDLGDAGVFGHLEQRAGAIVEFAQPFNLILCVLHHGAVLVDREGDAVFTGAFLTEDCRAFTVEADGNGDARHQRRQKYEGKGGDDTV